MVRWLGSVRRFEPPAVKSIFLGVLLILILPGEICSLPVCDEPTAVVVEARYLVQRCPRRVVSKVGRGTRKTAWKDDLGCARRGEVLRPEVPAFNNAPDASDAATVL